jgi:hypothetical protein
MRENQEERDIEDRSEAFLTPTKELSAGFVTQETVEKLVEAGASADTVQLARELVRK